MRPGARPSLGFVTLYALSIAVTCVGQVSGAELGGGVTDENEAPVPGARVTVHPAEPSSAGPWRTRTDPAGAFSISLPSPGDYLIDVRHEAHYELNGRPVHLETALDITLVVNSVREVFQSLDVNEQPSPVDIAQTHKEERLTGTEVNDVPYRNSHSLRNSMKLMPGVVDDPGGGMHFNGSSENQVQYVLNGFNITDPVSSRFRTTLAVEGVRSAGYTSGRYSLDNRSLTVAAQNQCLRAARVGKRYVGRHSRLGMNWHR